jgi:hypothetical protein
MFAGRATQHSAIGSIAAGELFGAFAFTAGASDSTVEIKEGGSGGIVRLTLKALAGTTGSQIGPLQISSPYIESITAGALLVVIA